MRRKAPAIEQIARGHNPAARTLLDVACGTGRHLEHLRSTFETAGVDADAGMLEIARARLPGVPLSVGDMRDLDLGRRFDVVTCLFSAIGFAHDLDVLGLATASLARHVGRRRDPAARALGHARAVDLEPAPCPRGRAERCRRRARGLERPPRADLDGRDAIPGRDPRGSREFAEHLEFGLFTHDEMRHALEATGLSVAHDPEGLIGRGLWLGMR